MRYDYAPKPLNGALLTEQIIALALPGFAGWVITTDGQIGVYVVDALSATDKSRLDAVIASHDSTQLSSSGIDANGDTAVSLAFRAAIALDTPISDLQSARTALQTARTALTSAVASVHTADDSVQAATTATAMLPAVKAISTALRAFCDAQANGDLALANGEQALANALQALKARFA